MKAIKLLSAIFTLTILLSLSAFAVDDDYSTDSESGTFTATVGAALEVTGPTGSVDLGKVLPTGKLTSLNSDKALLFTVNGEAGENVTLTGTGPDEDNGVTVTGAWSWGTTATHTFDLVTAGNEFTYTASGITASKIAASGSRNFTVTLKADYTLAL